MVMVMAAGGAAAPACGRRPARSASRCGCASDAPAMRQRPVALSLAPRRVCSTTRCECEHDCGLGCARPRRAGATRLQTRHSSRIKPRRGGPEEVRPRARPAASAHHHTNNTRSEVRPEPSTAVCCGRSVVALSVVSGGARSGPHSLLAAASEGVAAEDGGLERVDVPEVLPRDAADNLLVVGRRLDLKIRKRGGGSDVSGRGE